MLNLSVLILARNEEKNMRDCIASVAFADEIIVIDDNSTDGTKQICEELGAKVYNRAMNGDWGGQQTFAIQQATCEWIFFIDADERVTPRLAEEIKATVIKNEKFGYWIKRINHFKQQRVDYGVLRPDYVCRLMPREGSYVEGFVHPTIVHQYKDEKLKGEMIHYTYSSWEQHLNKFNNYTTLAAEKMYKEGKRCNVIFDLVTRPIFSFIKMYVLQGGFRDGVIGWELSCLHFAYTLTKYVKLRAIQQERGV